MSSMVETRKKPVIGYLCSYFPVQIAEQLGLDLICLGEEDGDVSRKTAKLPVNICGYVRYCQRLIEQSELDGIVITNCCNGMQRLYDMIRINYPELFCYMLELPRGMTKAEEHYYHVNIQALVAALQQSFSLSGHEPVSLNPTPLNGDNTFVPEYTIYVLGSAASLQMKAKLSEYLQPYPVRFNLCHERSKNQDSFNEYLASPCARMSYFTTWFADFLAKNHSRIAGMIYMVSQHCDLFLFNYPEIQKLCNQYNLPVILIEEGYRQGGFGQISTRIEAFLESLMIRKRHRIAESNESPKQFPPTANQVFRKRMHLVQAITAKLPLTAIQKVVQNQIDLFTQKIWEQPEQFIWTNMVMPAELFYAAGLIPVNMELVAGWLASLGLSREYIGKSEGLGFSANLCSYHKATLGLIEAGGLPYPRCVAVSSNICDGGPGVANYFAGRYQSRSFILNAPFHSNKANQDYVVEQYRQLKQWLEGYIGHTITDAKLAEALDLSNQAREYWLKAFELRKGEPLFPGHLSLRNLFGATFLFGSPLGVEVAQAYYQQLLDMKQQEKVQLPVDKGLRRKRILWIHFAPLYNNKIMEYLEQELNCWIVMDITGHIYWPSHEVTDPLSGLAQRTLTHFYFGEPVLRDRLYRRLVEEYKIDGIIHFVHNGCRPIAGGAWQVRGIADSLKIPYLELAGDCIDPRGFSEEQMRLRLDAFRETLGRDLFVSGH